MVWLICSALVMISGYFVLAPLFGKDGDLDAFLVAETELDRLQDRKSAIEKSLSDLDFEFKMGLLSDADFKQLEAGYRSEAAVVIQAIERIDREKAKSANRSSAKCPACGAASVPGKKYCADCGYKF
jgi:hypothetical protein